MKKLSLIAFVAILAMFQAVSAYCADTTPPTGTVKINNNAIYTNSTTVALSLSAADTSSGISKMKFSNNNTTYSGAQPYATAKSWVLASNNGVKTVYVKYEDAAGNWSEAYSDTIILDTIAPAKPVINTVTSPTNSASQTITGTKTSDTTSIVVTCPTANISTVRYSTSTTWSCALTNLKSGSNNISVKARDAAGNESVPATAIIVANITAPTGTITINNGNQYTKTIAVTLTLSATAPGSNISQMRFSVDNISWSAAEAYNTIKSCILPTGDGTKTVYVKYKDTLGNWSSTYSDTIILDTIAPAKPVINVITSPIGSVRQTISGTKAKDATSIMVTCPTATVIAIRYTTSAKWSCDITNLKIGSNTISVKARDVAGNESVSVIVIIVADLIPPTGTVVINNGNPYTNSSAVTLTLSAADAESSVSQMRFSNDNVTWSVAETYTDTKSWTLATGDGTKTAYVKYKDAAGNWSGTYSDTIILDTTPPNAPTLNPVISPTKTNTQNLSGNKDANTSIWINGAEAVALNSITTWSYVLNLIEGANNISVIAKDALGNASVAVNAVIIYDPTADWITSFSVSPNAFSPNGDTSADNATINYLITKDGIVTVKLYDSLNNLVRTLKNNVSETAGSHTVIWDGKDSSGVMLSDATYTCKIDAIDSLGNPAIQKQGTVTIDNHPMRIIEPISGTSLVGTLTFKAMPSANIHSETDGGFQYRAKGTSSWIQIGLGNSGIKQADGSWITSWDTTTVSSGNYEVRAYSRFHDLNDQLRWDYDAPADYSVNNGIVISSFSVSPNAFSPNGDNSADNATINYLITKDGIVTVKLYDSLNNLVRTLKNNVSETAGSHTVIWDGKDSSGVMLSDATYTCKIDAIDSLGNPAIQKQGTVTIDNHPMRIIEPISGTSLVGTLTFKAMPSANIHSETDGGFQYRAKGTSSWIQIGLGNSGIKQADGSWITSWDTTTVSSGNYEVRAYSRFHDLNDQLRWDYDAPADYSVNNGIVISSFSVSPNAFSPNGDNSADNATINYLITKDGIVTVKLYDSLNNLVRTLKNNVSETAGSHTVIWDGKDSSGVMLSDATYTCKIDAIDSLGNPAIQKQGTVTIDNHPMRIIEPISGTSLVGTLTFKAMPSANIHSETDGGFQYRAKGTSSWIQIGLGNSGIKQADGSWITSWDTTTVSSGNYEVRAYSRFHDLNDQLRWDYDAPADYSVNNGIVISSFSVSPNAFSPNGDTSADNATINYLITKDGIVTVKLYDSLNNLVRTLKNNVSETAGSHTVIWDGKDSSGVMLSDAAYTCKIDATDSLGNSAIQKQGTVTIDNHFMIIVEPATDANLTDTVIFRAVHSSNTRSEDTIELRYRAKGTAVWILIGNADKQGDGTWTKAWNTATISSGDYEVRISGRYTDLNNTQYRWECSSPYSVHICHPGGYFTSPTIFSPNGDSILDTTSLIANFGQNANWTISIKDTLANEVRYFTGTAQNITQAWDGKNGSGTIVPDGIYSLNINAVSVATGQNILTGSANVEVDNSPPTASISQPLPNSQISGTVPIKGIVDDLHFDKTNASLFWGEGVFPSQWNMLAQFNSPILTESTLASWDTGGLKNGAYVLRLLVSDLVGNIKDIKVPINVYDLLILNHSDSPDPFTPDGDGDKDTSTISAALNTILDWKITITDKSNNLIRQFTGSGDAISQVWDAKNASNQIVADGVYYYKIEATDPATSLSASPVTDTITADTTLPIAIISFPTNDSTIGSVIDVLGTASDTNLVNYKVEYGEGAAPTSWNLINSSPSPVTNGLLTKWDSARVTNGAYTLRLTVTDRAGYVATAQVTVNADNIKIIGVSVTPDIINPYSGESTAIGYTIDRDANMTIKLYDLDNNLKRTLISAMPKVAGSNLDIWDGKNDAGTNVPDNAYTITIEAQSGSSTGWYQSSGGFVHNAVIATDFNVTQNFSPYNNELCRAEYTLPENALFLLQAGQHEGYNTYVSVINWEVRTKGHHAEYWNGRDVNGRIFDYYVFPYIIFGYQTQSLPNNSVVVTGAQTDPVSIIANPYAFMPAYGEFTMITYTIPLSGNVSVSIRKDLGQLVKNILSNTSQAQGAYTLSWDGRDSSGKMAGYDDNYIIQVDVTGPDGRVVRASGSITTR